MFIIHTNKPGKYKDKSVQLHGALQILQQIKNIITYINVWQ